MIWLAWVFLVQAGPDQTRIAEAQQLAAQGNCGEAEPLLKELSGTHSRNAQILFALGQCQFNEKDYATALDSFKRVL